MAIIQLSRGLSAMVDDDDLPRLAALNWYAHWAPKAKAFYAVAHPIGRRNGTVQMHRLILEASPRDVVDHRDHNTLNNTKENLRRCSRAQNMQNSRKGSRTSSKFKGVVWSKRTRAWMARITMDGKLTYLGTFADEVDAARAYDSAAIQHFGAFACPNFAIDEGKEQ